MSRIVVFVSLFAVICFISVAFATECYSGPDGRVPETCPGFLQDSSKTHCCKDSGSFYCCDEEEFTLRAEYNDDDDAKPLDQLRYKRDYNYDIETTVSTGAIVGFILLALIPVGLIICCCCCCCACCPCYHWCHPNATNVTIVQQPFGFPGQGGQNNFSIAMPNQQGMTVDPPPQYCKSGYDKLSESSVRGTNYVQ